MGTNTFDANNMTTYDSWQSLATTIMTTTNSTDKPPSRTLTYIYGTLSVLIVSLLSLAGAAILPFLKNKTIYRGSLLLFMSLAVGTMISDAVLHLIPEALSVHGHVVGEKDHDHKEHNNGEDHNHEEDSKFAVHKNEKNYLGHMVALLASLYFLFLFEMVTLFATKTCKTLSSVADITHGHSHSHSGPHTHSDSSTNPVVAIEMKPPSAAAASSSPPTVHSNTICGLKSVAIVILFGDGLHNFADGLAIGAAFAQSSTSGLATSIAVVCHELPHEVGDFAVLINSGLSAKKALFLNFLSALTAFLGLYIGIEAGQLQNVRQWIFAVVAGGFLYVALVHMLNEIRDTTIPLPTHLVIILQNAGILIGFVIILLLALYEDNLNGGKH